MLRIPAGSRYAIAGLAIASAALAACGGGSSARTVAVTELDYHVTPSVTSVAAGKVSFKIHNGGGFTHEFVVDKYDDASDLPKDRNGEVNEDAVPASRHIGETSGIKPGTTQTLTLTLPAGKYVLFCNLTDGKISHFARGMHADLSVTG